MTPSPIDRNYSMDALRVLAMLMVVVLHIAGFTGLAKIPFSEYPLSRLLSSAEHSFSMCAVNVYAMLTGYFCINSTRFKLERYIRLWLLVAFYTVAIYAGFVLGSALFPDWIQAPKLPLFMFYPIPMASGYWYFNAYTVVFLMIPFVNGFLQTLSEKRYRLLLMLILIALPGLQLLNLNTGIGSGHNAVWLLIMYCAGAYLKLHPLSVKRRYILLAMGALLGLMMGLGALTTSGACGSSNCLPYHVLMGICLMLFFSRTTISAQWLCKIISQAAPLAFGVYIIHLHPFIWGRLPEWLEMAGEYRMQWWFIPVASLTLFVACLLIDYCRVLLFRLCRAEALVQLLTRWCIKLYECTIGKILIKTE